MRYIILPFTIRRKPLLTWSLAACITTTLSSLLRFTMVDYRCVSHHEDTSLILIHSILPLQSRMKAVCFEVINIFLRTSRSGRLATDNRYDITPITCMPLPPLPVELFDSHGDSAGDARFNIAIIYAGISCGYALPLLPLMATYATILTLLAFVTSHTLPLRLLIHYCHAIARLFSLKA